MKNEKPILFNAEMVRAILDGRKTQTRRVITSPFDRKKLPENLKHHDNDGYSGDINDNMSWGYPCAEDGDDVVLGNSLEFCPLGNIGDELWVRENHAFDQQMDSVKVSDMSFNEPIFYPATNQISVPGCAMISVGKTRPSIHMPRWASRIQLLITDIRIERLNAISAADAVKEGLRVCHKGLPKGVPPVFGFADEIGNFDENLSSYSPVKAFSYLWQSIYGEKSWTDNPWVWVIEFERIEK